MCVAERRSLLTYFTYGQNASRRRAREASGSARTVRASCVSRFTHCATLCKPYTSEFNSVGRYTGGVFISVKRRPPRAIARPLTHAAATRHSTCVLTVTPIALDLHVRSYVRPTCGQATERRCAPQMAHPRHRCSVHRIFMDQPTCMLKSSFGARAQCMLRVPSAEPDEIGTC